jgi:tRNA A37 methylthiotransferase MiaB
MRDQVPTEVKKQRSAALIATGKEARDARLQLALQSPLRSVLFETWEKGLAVGHTPEFLEVAAPTEIPLHGEIHTVRLHSAENGRLIGEIER